MHNINNFHNQKSNIKMKSKILATVLVILSVVLYTLAVINFIQGDALGGIADVAMACSDVIMAFVVWRLAFLEQLVKTVGKELFSLLKALEKGVPATLTIRKGNDDDEDDPDEIPEDELTADEKRIKRMAEEYDELCGRLERLTAFLATDKFKQLPENSRTLLEHQSKAMEDYRATLQERIKIDCANANKDKDKE